MNNAPADRSAIKAELENDRRNVSDLFNQVLREYTTITGDVLTPDFRNVDSMIDDALQQESKWSNWRHDGKKLDKLRSFAASNISLIEQGAQKLVDAVSSSFPPAIVIGTAMKFVISGCKSLSSDYNVITAFFEDMNSFLQRVSIIEGRVPRTPAYQRILMDVFASMIRMCAFARKYIKQERFKKWIKNSFSGQDAELAGGRKAMDTALSRLQAATEFAILRNSEDSLENQKELQRMQVELYRNQELQQRIAADQSLMLNTILDQQNTAKNAMDNIVDFLVSFKAESRAAAREIKSAPVKSAEKRNQARSTRNWARSQFPEAPECRAELKEVQQAMVEGTNQWIFDNPAWISWFSPNAKQSSPATLLVVGGPGSGKSHVGVSVHKYLMDHADATTDEKACVAYFCFRTDREFMGDLEHAMEAAMIQISDQSPSLRGQLKSATSADAEDMPVLALEYWTKLIAPMFGKSSKYQLFMVLDGLDEMEDDVERESLMECIKLISEQGLRIKLFCTTRSDYALDMDKSGVEEIHLTRDLMLPDLKLIIRDRLQSTDSAYSGLTRFSKHHKQVIYQRIEQLASTPLYVEHLLRYLSIIGREGAVMKMLEEEAPKDINDLYLKMLKQAQRRLPAGAFRAIKSLFAWLSFSFRPLIIHEANALVRQLAPTSDINIGEEIQETFSQFLQVDDPVSGKDNDMQSSLGTAIPFSAVLPSQTADHLDDGNLRITFRQRSMKEFLSGLSNAEKDDLRTPALDAHSQMFLLCAALINDRTTMLEKLRTPERGLYEYALGYCLQHWCYVDPHNYSDQNNVPIVEAFTGLIMDGHFAAGLEALGPDWAIKDLIEDYKDEFDKTWELWSQWVDGAPLKKYVDKATLAYWTGEVENALVPLARSHIQNWLQATDRRGAIRSYRFARSVIDLTKHRNILDEYDEEGLIDDQDEDDVEENRCKEEILGLASLFELKLDSNAHYAIGVMLDMRGDRGSAKAELETAIETCRDLAHQARNYEQLAVVSLHKRQWDEAQHLAELSFTCSANAPSVVRSQALITKGTAQMRSEAFGEAARTFETARLEATSVVESENLWLEIFNHWQNDDAPAIMKALVSFKSIERLNLLVYLNLWNEWSEPDVPLLLILAATRTGQVDVLISIYEAVIKSLDAKNAGAPLRLNLAHLHWRAKQDTAAAKALLNQVLDSFSHGEEYELTEADPANVAVRAMNMMTDILFTEFHNAKDPKMKAEILETVQNLQHRNLPQLSQIQPSQLTPYQLVLSRMLRRMGPSVEYEKVMNQAFQTCMENLNDSVTWNDQINIYHLAMVLSYMGGSLKTYAELTNAAQFYKIDEDAEHDESGDDTLDHATNGPALHKLVTLLDAMSTHLSQASESATDHNISPTTNDASFTQGSQVAHVDAIEADKPAVDMADEEYYDVLLDGSNVQYCKGQCFPRVAFEYWDKDENPMYQCLTCTESVLCGECYELRMKYNEEAASKPATEPDFCCARGRYLHGPTAGWKGIRDGKIYVENKLDAANDQIAEPVDFKDLLNTIKEAWSDAWAGFWADD